MQHLSGQTIQTVIALLIVAAAALAVGRRLWAQVAGFRSARRRPRAQPAPAPPLIQIQPRPPAHLRRPPADGP